MVLRIVCVLLPVVLVLGIVRKYRESSWGYCKNFDSLQGRVFIVTGANSGLGKETVRGLAIRKARIIMACRDMTKTKATIKDIRKTITTGELVSHQLCGSYPNCHVSIML